MKLQQKISGTFQSEEGARNFCRVRGFIATVKKHSRPVLPELARVVEGTPFVPTTAHPHTLNSYVKRQPTSISLKRREGVGMPGFCGICGNLPDRFDLPAPSKSELCSTAESDIAFERHYVKQYVIPKFLNDKLFFDGADIFVCTGRNTIKCKRPPIEVWCSKQQHSVRKDVRATGHRLCLRDAG